VASLLAGALQNLAFSVDVSDTLSVFEDENLARYSVIIPIFTMSAISKLQLASLLSAVKGGVGLAGCHGGMCDAFRNETEYQFMTGGQWVAHPGNDGRLYTVNICDDNPITQGIRDFEVRSEKYYMHVDPAIRVHATTSFEDYDNTLMPVTWTKRYDLGRVFYCSLGHQANIVAMPEVMAMMTRGIRWAAGEWSADLGKPFARVYAAAA
jgi:hypothetical protein